MQQHGDRDNLVVGDIMKTLDKDRESLLCRLADEATKRANAGENPNSAIADLSMAHQLSEPMIQRLCEAINVGRTLDLFKESSNRTNEFPIADAAEVLRLVDAAVPAVKNAACPDLYSMAYPSAVKVAHTRGPTEEPVSFVNLYRRSSDAVKSERRQRDWAFIDVNRAKEAMIRASREICGYFSRRPQQWEPFESHILSSDEHAPLLEFIRTAGNLDQCGIKRGSAQDIPAIATPEGLDVPIRLFEKCCQCLEDLVAAIDVYRQRVECAEQEEQQHKTAWDKFGAGLEGWLGTPDGKQEAPVSAPDLKSLLRDPEHEGEIQAIRAATTLHPMLQYDEVLSRADPELVARLYNTIIHLVPKLSDQPVLLQGILRRAVHQGGTLEPFDLTQLTRIQKERENALSGYGGD